MQLVLCLPHCPHLSLNEAWLDVTVVFEKRRTSKVEITVKAASFIQSPTSSDPTSADGNVNARITQTLAAWPVGGKLLGTVQDGGNMT